MDSKTEVSRSLVQKEIAEHKKKNTPLTPHLVFERTDELIMLNVMKDRINAPKSLKFQSIDAFALQVLDNEYHLVGLQVTIAQSHFVRVRGLVDLCAKIELATKRKIDNVDIVFVKLDEDNMKEFKRQRFAPSKQSPDKENETAWLGKKVYVNFSTWYLQKNWRR